MIEAQIICCRECEIRDLGLKMMPGQEQWVADLVAGNSADLRKEQGKGNVRVYRKSRRVARAPKLPPPPFVVRSRPPPRPRPEPQVIERVIEKVVEVVETTVDTEELARQVKAELMGDLRETVAEEMRRMLKAQQDAQETPPTPAPFDAGQLEHLLEAVLRRVMPASGGAPSQEKIVEFEEPLYLPGKLVDKNAKARIAVRERASEEDGGDLDDAASALRKFKKRRAGRTNEER